MLKSMVSFVPLQQMILAQDSSPQGFAREKDVESLAVVCVNFAMEKDPVVRRENLFGSVYKTWFGVARGVHDLPGHVVRRSEHDETENCRSAV